MSLGLLLIAVRDRLRDQLEGFGPDDIMVMPGPEPIPSCGEKFISIYGGVWSFGPDDDQNMGLDEVYGVNCAVSFRAPATPMDRRGDELYIEQLTGLEKICRRIMKAVHQDLDVFVAWSDLVERYESEEWTDLPTEYLRWSDTDAAPIPQDGEWFSAAPDAACGLVMEVRFRDARRMHSIRSEERIE